MKKFKVLNKESLASVILIGGILAGTCGCMEDIKHSNTTDVEPKLETTLPVDQTEYTDMFGHTIDLEALRANNYHQVNESNKYMLFGGSCIYYMDYNGNFIKATGIYESTVVSVLRTNDVYSVIECDNENMAFVANSRLLKCAQLHKSDYMPIAENNTTTFSLDAWLYDNNGMFLDNISSGQPCYANATNGEYTLVTLTDGRSGYVISNALSDKYNQIVGFAYAKTQIPMYTDNELTSVNGYVDENKVIGITSYNDKYCQTIINNMPYYVKTSDVLSKFIVVDLEDQRIGCYKNYKLVGCWKTRTGKASTPTHEGAFDIDAECPNFTFTKYPDAHATCFIPINEFEEGLHDLIGDDENNYGNQDYLTRGSHGCIRVPEEAIVFIHENYDVGDMVIVSYDSKSLILFNYEDNELIVLDTDSFNKSRTR